MPTFNGSITTTGKSEAIRLDKALFRLHPEFRQKAKVRAQVLSPGHALISVVDDDSSAREGEDPIVTAYLSLVESDMKSAPRRKGLSKDVVRKAVRLTRRVKVKDDDAIPLDVTI